VSCPLPGAAVSVIAASLLVVQTAILTDKDPGLALLDLYAKKYGKFLLATMADFALHDFRNIGGIQ